MASKVFPVKVQRTEKGTVSVHDDLVAVEEPLEIRLGYGKPKSRAQKTISVTMRTPGNDMELALGFLYTEGIITSIEEIDSIKHCADVGKEMEKENVVRAELKPGISLDFEKLDRHFYTNSSCGVCGKTSIESIYALNCSARNDKTPQVSASLIAKLADSLDSKQLIFKHTGGLHAVELYDLKSESILVREDIGRHNAFDKVVGAALQDALLPLDDYLVILSGRASFELVQKAIVAGIPIIAAVGAPSSLAVETAKNFGLTLIGFLRNKRFNIYCGDYRIT